MATPSATSAGLIASADLVSAIDALSAVVLKQPDHVLLRGERFSQSMQLTQLCEVVDLGRHHVPLPAVSASLFQKSSNELMKAPSSS